MKPSAEEIAEFLKLVEKLNAFAAIHGIATEPVPAAIKVYGWLRAQAEDDRS